MVHALLEPDHLDETLQHRLADALLVGVGELSLLHQYSISVEEVMVGPPGGRTKVDQKVISDAVSWNQVYCTEPQISPGGALFFPYPSRNSSVSGLLKFELGKLSVREVPPIEPGCPSVHIHEALPSPATTEEFGHLI